MQPRRGDPSIARGKSASPWKTSCLGALVSFLNSRLSIAPVRFGLRFRFQLGQHLFDVGIGWDVAAFLCPAILRLEFLKSAAGRELAERAHLVDVKDSVQMIDLVLPDSARQFVGGHF